MSGDKPFTFKQYSDAFLSAEKTRRSVNNTGPIPIALVYPNSYSVGMSSLGYQTVYRLFAQQNLFQCERCFVYDPPFYRRPLTLETRKDLSTFPFIAFSVSFELDYFQFVLMLQNAGIPARADQRRDSDPIIFCGGVTTFYNPAVLAPIVDAFFIGEAEVLIPDVTKVLENVVIGTTGRREILQNLSEITGCYVPLIHQTPCAGLIKRQYADISKLEPATSVWITPKAHFGMFLVEVGRGCGRGCRFCAAGHVYLPFRCWLPEIVFKTIEKYAQSGDKIGLVGAALSDFRQLDKLINKLMESNYKIGLSSLRSDRLSNDLLQALKKSGVMSVTLAPEAGSERLRRIINKQLTEETILQAAERLSRANIADIKLYFMIGLPFETQNDLASIVKLVKLTSDIFNGRSIHTSLNAFVPKPFTPFQWARMETEANLKKKRKWLNNELRRIKSVTVTNKSSREEVLQGILSVGDTNVGDALCSGKLLATTKLKTAFDWLYSEKFFETPLPWDYIDCGIEKRRLWNSWQEAKRIANEAG
ncbi:radical SAM protein [candidate division KSB1 bacterium]|nr:radical SAM protein [candidate division KSB1 bacterium]